jgi:hypothetical protein
VDLASNNISDVVLHPEGGYWLASSDAQATGSGLADVQLLHFSVSGTGASTQLKLDSSVSVATDTSLNERAPYLAPFGHDGLLVGWETSTATNDLPAKDMKRTLHVQARNAVTGEALGDALQVNLPGNRYQSFREFADGSVGFPTRGSTATSTRILRVLPCERRHSIFL